MDEQLQSIADLTTLSYAQVETYVKEARMLNKGINGYEAVQVGLPRKMCLGKRMILLALTPNYDRKKMAELCERRLLFCGARPNTIHYRVRCIRMGERAI